MLPEFLSAARVSEYVCDMEYLFSRMNVGSYGATEAVPRTYGPWPGDL